ncbi:uncharacterized protein TRIVIDRAFT_221824 [Trichoderma virens Gv29-8]|uniref:Uncharacterized protein n=1 Tax=Hypocrea virens (strain Gv29-8 / FGSC 10586) TaxID=413071 RepID=G9MR28_HYPVG|nr:uncharacterized protein TRIVIDRAFT_221824 [Trichoderma virens Gv29-8]EHK22555.1 hypothetical protein TRIVIDRAFT_221824 [Trichoderma virens Gv29-8]UKZ47599.1 hypothetical protein TrVGV298_001822 [Trichoderma virens]
MVKRKSDASSTSPRKKAKLDEPTETLANAALSSSPSPTSSLSSTWQRREKRKRSDSTLVDDPDESDTSTNTKRAKTQSPTSSRRPSPSPNPNGARPVPGNDQDDWEWEWHDDHPEKFEHIYWEPTDLPEKAKRWRRRVDLLAKGYVGCVCGKMHYAIGRKSWHYPGQEPELEDPEEQLPEPDEPHVRSGSVSAYQSRGQERLLSPELSDDEEAVGNAQPNSAPSDVSSVREPSVAPELPVSVIAEASAVSPTNSPTNSPIVTPTANNSRLPCGRNNAQRNISKPTTPRRTNRKNKNKNKKDQESKDKTVKRQPRNRKPKTTLMVEEPVVSRRSSRRNAGSQLYFLDDSGKACLVAASSR